MSHPSSQPKCQNEAKIYDAMQHSIITCNFKTLKSGVDSVLLEISTINKMLKKTKIECSEMKYRRKRVELIPVTKWLKTIMIDYAKCFGCYSFHRPVFAVHLFKPLFLLLLLLLVARSSLYFWLFCCCCCGCFVNETECYNLYYM